MSSIAVFDIGNTSLKAGLASAGKCRSVDAYEYGSLTPRKLTKVLRAIARESGLNGAIASSVSPTEGARIREAWRNVSRIPLVFLNHRMKMPLVLKYPQPATIGTDRLAAASASFYHYKKEHIVMDVGTAVTVDCVDSRGCFLGGAIAPGPGVMTQYLSSNTGLLPEIDYSGAIPKIGRSTEGAMRLGVRVGYGSLLNSVVKHLKTGVFQGRDIPLIVTGGCAKRMIKDLEGKPHFVQNLTLEGLSLIYELNIQP